MVVAGHTIVCLQCSSEVGGIAFDMEDHVTDDEVDSGMWMWAAQ